jgi:hypothetical protein
VAAALIFIGFVLLPLPHWAFAAAGLLLILAGVADGVSRWEDYRRWERMERARPESMDASLSRYGGDPSDWRNIR